MHPHRFDRLTTALTTPSSRRGVLSAGFGVGLALIGLGASRPMGSEAKSNAAKRRQAKEQEAKKRVNECLRNAPAIICAGNPNIGNFYDACVANVSFCCQQMKSSRQAGCDCLLETGWGYCTA